jgi:hypothetical protein
LIEVDEAYVKVRNFLYENKGDASVSDIAEKTEVDEEIILYLLSENRLYMKTWTGNSKTCQICGTPIVTGTICNSCLAKMRVDKPSEATATAEPVKTTKTLRRGARMHITHDNED